MELKKTFAKAVALAVHTDTWAGDEIVALLPFRTKRMARR